MKLVNVDSTKRTALHHLSLKDLTIYNLPCQRG
jgi:hypothetical protein